MTPHLNHLNHAGLEAGLGEYILRNIYSRAVQRCVYKEYYLNKFQVPNFVIWAKKFWYVENILYWIFMLKSINKNEYKIILIEDISNT